MFRLQQEDYSSVIQFVLGGYQQQSHTYIMPRIGYLANLRKSLVLSVVRLLEGEPLEIDKFFKIFDVVVLKAPMELVCFAGMNKFF